MIDYDKLKIAHGLAEKLDKRMTIEILFFSFTKPRFGLIVNDHSMVYEEIDALIEELTELTKLKTKYKIGQEIWYLNCNHEICSGKIQRIDDKTYEKAMYFISHCDYVFEGRVYASKEELIDSQLEHWKSMKEGRVIGPVIKDITLGEQLRMSKKDICSHQPVG